jgi:hypothetical protein
LTARRKILPKKCHLQSLGSDRISEWILKAREFEGKDSSYSYWVQDIVFEECGEETLAFMKGVELLQ